ncbi:MAG: SAM-dependent methyltransferase [Verrucomicrobiota bacterium]
MSAAVLDACCGGRMMWFDKSDSRAVFIDKRAEELQLIDRSKKSGVRHLTVSPDLIADFTNLPFRDGSFSLVVFDPPHLKRGGKNSWMIAKYGKLEENWEEELRDGFSECWRVLQGNGTLIFKWSEVQIPLSRILPLAPTGPLFGNRCGKSNKLHWVVFFKEVSQGE